MFYFFAFLLLLLAVFVVLGSSTFLGRPLPGTPRITFSAAASYKVSGVIGLSPFLKRRCFAVIYGIPSISAISDIVKYSPFNCMFFSLLINVSQWSNLFNPPMTKLLKLLTVTRHLNYLTNIKIKHKKYLKKDKIFFKLIDNKCNIMLHLKHKINKKLSYKN